MKKKINNSIVYSPEDNKLQSIINPDKTVILNEPSARCLDILLSSNNEFVTHKELYEGGWAGSSQEPSPNTLYQNMLLIRRGLKDVSDEDINYIITVPRKGFYFNKNIPISVITENKETIGLENVHLDNGNISIKNKTNRINNFKKLNVVFTSIIIFISLILIIYFLVKEDSGKNSNFFDSYVHISNDRGCEFYLNKNNEMIISERNKNLLNYSINAVSCNEYPYRFITISRFSSDFYFFSCNKKDPSLEGFRCTSVYYQ